MAFEPRRRPHREVFEVVILRSPRVRRMIAIAGATCLPAMHDQPREEIHERVFGDEIAV